MRDATTPPPWVPAGAAARADPEVLRQECFTAAGEMARRGTQTQSDRRPGLPIKKGRLRRTS